MAVKAKYLVCLLTVAAATNIPQSSHLRPRVTPEHSARQVRSLLEFTAENQENSLPPLFQDVSENLAGRSGKNAHLIIILTNFQDFEAEVEVKNLFTGDSYYIQERVKRDSVWLQLNAKGDDKIRTCTYSKLSGFGHTIYGLECLPAVNLPSGCFCASSPSPTPYLPLTDLLALVAKKGVNRTGVSVQSKDFSSWHVEADNIHLTATFINDLNRGLQGLAPFTLSVIHNGKGKFKFSLILDSK